MRTILSPWQDRRPPLIAVTVRQSATGSPPWPAVQISDRRFSKVHFDVRYVVHGDSKATEGRQSRPNFTPLKFMGAVDDIYVWLSFSYQTYRTQPLVYFWRGRGSRSAVREIKSLSGKKDSRKTQGRRLDIDVRHVYTLLGRPIRQAA